MNDTSPDIEKKLSEMIQKKSPEERALMGSSMYETSRSLVIRAILEDNPDISPSALKQELFLKFYSDDFDARSKKEIIQHLNSL